VNCLVKGAANIAVHDQNGRNVLESVGLCEADATTTGLPNGDGDKALLPTDIGEEARVANPSELFPDVSSES